MEYIASHFVGDDVRGYFADCFSKVEDDVVYYKGADQKKKQLYFILVFIYTSIKVKSKRGRKKNFDKQTIFSFGRQNSFIESYEVIAEN